MRWLFLVLSLLAASGPADAAPETAAEAEGAAPSAEAISLEEVPSGPDAPSLGEAIAASPGAEDPDELVPSPDPVDPVFELKLLAEDVAASSEDLAAEGEENLDAVGAGYFAWLAEEAREVDESRVATAVPERDPEDAAPSVAAEPVQPGLAEVEPSAAHRGLPPGYHSDLQRAFLKYGADGSIPASSVNWLAETYDRRVVEVAHDLRQMARNAGVIIPEIEKTDPPTPPPTEPAVIPHDELAQSPENELRGAYLHALESVLEKYELVRLVPENSLKYLGRRYERTPEQVKTDLKSIAKPDTDTVLPDYAY